EGAQVEGHVERLLQRGLPGEVAPPEQPRDQHEVTRRRDGKVLGQALRAPEDDGVEERHWSRLRSKRGRPPPDEGKSRCSPNGGRQCNLIGLHVRWGFRAARPAGKERESPPRRR